MRPQTKMKTILNLLAALALLVTAFNSGAAEPRYVFAGSGTAISTTNAHYIVPIGIGDPIVQYLDATGDTSPSVLTFRTASSPTVLSAATAASPGTNLTCVGSAYSAGNVIVLQHVAADTYERLVVSTASATNITTTAAIGTAAVAGDVVWLMTTAATASGVTNTAGIQRGGNGSYLFTANRGKPILVNLTGANTPTLNTVSGFYLRR